MFSSLPFLLNTVLPDFLNAAPLSPLCSASRIQHDRMTGLANKIPQLTKTEYINLVNEAIYWLRQPEVQEETMACALAARSGHILGWISPSKDPQLTED